MIPSVKERKENASNFILCYEDICKILNRTPLPSVKTHLKKNILDFNGDRITYEEWGPILNALSLDRSLHFIAVRSTRSSKRAMEDIATESRARALERVPVIQTRFVLLSLMKAIRACMNNTEMLTCMELEGLPLSSDYLNELVQGITSCGSLRNISLHRSTIEDEGCALLCLAIRGLSNIISLDFSNCGLTERGALSVAETVKYQKIQRYSESWKQTLRYREPDLDSLPGLRRVTLNHNEGIKDQGAQHLMDVVKDDLFLKALDLQNCGIGNSGGQAALDALQSNVSLAIVDLRVNRDLNPDLLREIMRQLHANNQGAPQEYHWIAIDRFQLPMRVRPKSQPLAKKTVSVKMDKVLTPPVTSKWNKSSKGVPWRVCVRLDRRREHAEMSPGTSRAVQYQEQYPPYRTTTPPPTLHCVELEKAKMRLLHLSNQLASEMLRRKKVEEEKVALQRRLDEVLGQNDCVLVKKQVMDAIRQSISDFETLMQELRDKGFGELLNVETLNSLDKDDKKRLSFLMRKSMSAYTTRDRSNQTDLHKVSKSASMFRDVGRKLSTLHVEATGVGDAGHGRVRADANIVTCQECSSDGSSASEVLLLRDCAGEKAHRKSHSTKQDKTNDILYQTVLRKNKDLDGLKARSLKAPTDALLCQHNRGDYSTSSSSSVPEEGTTPRSWSGVSKSYHSEDDLF